MWSPTLTLADHSQNLTSSCCNVTHSSKNFHQYSSAACWVILTNRQAGRQTDRHTDRQTDRRRRVKHILLNGGNDSYDQLKYVGRGVFLERLPRPEKGRGPSVLKILGRPTYSTVWETVSKFWDFLLMRYINLRLLTYLLTYLLCMAIKHEERKNFYRVELAPALAKNSCDTNAKGRSVYGSWRCLCMFSEHRHMQAHIQLTASHSASSVDINYRQDAAKRQTAGIKFTHRSKIRFFAPQGRLVAPTHVKLAGPTGTWVAVQNFT